MVHLLPLPGAPRWGGTLAHVLDRARADARALIDGGVDALLVENYGDVPFFPHRVPPETTAAMTASVAAVVAVAAETDRAGAAAPAPGQQSRGPIPVGVNVLRNDAAAALAVAAATGASFIRVNVHTGGMYTDQGWIEGRAAETLRMRERLAPDVAILADVLVKHAAAPPGVRLEDAARDAWERGLADGLVVSGAATGRPTSLEEVRRLRILLADARIMVGSGVTAETVAEALEVADAVIVGSALERGGRAGSPVDPERVRRMMRAAGRG